MLDHRPARHHHVVALAVELDHLELELFALEVARILHRSDVDQRPGKKGTDVAYRNRVTALHLAGEHALDDIVGLEGFFELVPCLGAARLLARQTGLPETVFDGLDGHLDPIAGLDGQRTDGVAELGARYLRLGLETRVDDNVIALHAHDLADHDLTGSHYRLGQALFEQLCETFCHLILLNGESSLSRSDRISSHSA